MRHQRLTGLLLAIILILLLLSLFSCATGSSDGNGAARTGDSTGAVTVSDGPLKNGRFRLILGRNTSSDSVAVVNDFFVDQALRQALDSIPAAEYVRLNVRDSLAASGTASSGEGIATTELAKKLNLDGVVATRIARFGSILAVELRILNPATSTPLFRDVAWSVIRYRDTSGTMLLGPTLYDAIRQLVGRYFKVAHLPQQPVATEPLIIGSVVIAKDPALGQISVNRGKISNEGVKALGEFARMHYPELVAFDYQSRNELYRTVGVAAVEDFVAVGNQERRALFNVGIDRFLVASVGMKGDSLNLRLELRYLVNTTLDTLIDAEERLFGRTQFETSTNVDETVIALIDLAEPLYKREAIRIAQEYAGRTTRKP